MFRGGDAAGAECSEISSRPRFLLQLTQSSRTLGRLLRIFLLLKKSFASQYKSVLQFRPHQTRRTQLSMVFTSTVAGVNCTLPAGFNTFEAVVSFDFDILFYVLSSSYRRIGWPYRTVLASVLFSVLTRKGVRNDSKFDVVPCLFIGQWHRKTAIFSPFRFPCHSLLNGVWH